MLNLIIELSKYFLLILIVLYTFESFTVFKYEDDYDKRYILRKTASDHCILGFYRFFGYFFKDRESGDYLSFWGVAAIPDYCAGLVSHFL